MVDAGVEGDGALGVHARVAVRLEEAIGEVAAEALEDRGRAIAVADMGPQFRAAGREEICGGDVAGLGVGGRLIGHAEVAGAAGELGGSEIELLPAAGDGRSEDGRR